jgi:TetR/AcrR family transcriptional regulator, repressor for uid operon
MNIHSHSKAMLQNVQDTPVPDRRSRILDAAERCFVRSGFHRTTMQDVAAEAGMSPGNLYRYFPSKDAIVAGLSERDRARVAQDFETFATDDFMKSFARLGRKHFEEEPREKAILCLEIWAEAARNPTFAKLCADFEHEVVKRLTEMLQEAKDRGDISPEVDPHSVAILISTLADGLFVRRAVVPSFDAAREVPNVINLIGALLSGAVSLNCAPPERASS